MLYVFEDNTQEINLIRFTVRKRHLRLCKAAEFLEVSKWMCLSGLWFCFYCQRLCCHFICVMLRIRIPTNHRTDLYLLHMMQSLHRCMHVSACKFVKVSRSWFNDSFTVCWWHAPSLTMLEFSHAHLWGKKKRRQHYTWAFTCKHMNLIFQGWYILLIFNISIPVASYNVLMAADMWQSIALTKRSSWG